jgi:uncharacterized repeat protein (TIGR01451 family)
MSMITETRQHTGRRSAPAVVVRWGLAVLLAAFMIGPVVGQNTSPDKPSKKPMKPNTSPILPLGQFHGVSISKVCESPKKVGESLSCDVILGYDDDFGDTIRILTANDRINPGPDETLLPMEIIAVFGNTTATVGGPLPVLIGPAGSTLSGLPGLPEPGVVVFQQNTYVIQADDPDPLPDRAEITVQDLCDAPGTVGCSSLEGIVSFPASTDIINPSLTIEKTADPTIICPGPPGTSVTYTYVVTNTGDTPLETVVVVDDGCAPVMGPLSGDVDNDNILDIAEEFLDVNGNGVWDPGEPIIMDNGNGVWDDTEVWTYECTTVLNAGFTNTATVTAAPVGFPECVLEETAQATVTEYPRPVANPDNGGICNGQDTMICANPSGGSGAPYTFDWTGPGGFTSTDECITVSVPGSYCVVVTDSNGCASIEACGLVVLNPDPTCAIQGLVDVCALSSNVYSGPAGMASYLWTIAGDGAIVGPNNLQTVQVLAGAIGGSYTLTLDIVDANGCPGSCQLIVEIIDCTVTEEPGWNWVDNVITLTGDQPTYWSALTGLPGVGGMAPFTSLDPGFPPGRPAMDGTTDRVLRGYALAWAVDSITGDPIGWNHLSGHGTIVNYRDGFAWEYNTWSFRRINENDGGTVSLAMDGVDYAHAPDLLLFNFQAVGSTAWSGPRQIDSNTDVTLHPVDVDLRQENDGPVTTKADFSIWNMNEVKFSETHRCITCWDQQLLSLYGTPNSFLLDHLQTDHGKARVDGKASQVCNVDVDPGDGAFPPADPANPQPGESNHPDDVVSQDAALLGVTARMLTFDGAGGDAGAAGSNMWVLGCQDAEVQADEMSSPPPEGGICEDRVSSTDKGSLLYFSKIELRWDANGFLVQDTFLSLTNDYPDDVTVQLYFINGDAPIAAPMPATQGEGQGQDALLDLLRTIGPDTDKETIKQRLDEVLEGLVRP